LLRFILDERLLGKSSDINEQCFFDMAFPSSVEFFVFHRELRHSSDFPISQDCSHIYQRIEPCINMDVAAGHNNRGISLLEEGLHEQALAEFKKAAQVMYTITQEIKDASPRLIGISESNTECFPSRNPIATDNLFIRSTPVIMSPPKETPAVCHCTIESAAVLLNMAIAYHINSQKPNCLKDAMQGAITLYDMAYGLSLRVHDDARSNHIILTALNNLGQIYFEIGEYAKSQLYFDDLSTYVMFLGQDGEGNAENGRRECILNAMVLRNPSTSAAAA
jgi:tetratricopeptide (TPR) repeat protein